MGNGVNVDPRYLSYNKDEVQALLDKVENADGEPTPESENMISSGAVAAALEGYASKEDVSPASAESVRNIVKDWLADDEPEPEPEPEL